MPVFAQIDLEPLGVIAWVVAGLVAGILAGQVIRGSGYGPVGDLVIGLIGAVAGGFLFRMVLAGTPGLVGSVAAAFASACLLIWAVRAVAPGRGYA